MSIETEQRVALLRERAAEIAGAAIAGITREYPVMPLFVATGPGPYPTHREQHPAFYGCFDWHSAVEMHWVLVRLLKLLPREPIAAAAQETLRRQLTSENLAVELRFFQQPQHLWIERPYGWGWLLTLQHELETWDDPEGRRWAEAVRPLAHHIVKALVGWLPRLSHPVRIGVHSNTAFALSRSWDYARLLAGQGDLRLLDAIRFHAGKWFGADIDCPARYEPSGTDFLSPCLCEADLMSRLLESGAFAEWLSSFLPGLAREEPASLFTPAEVSDPTDGQIAHLHGLNLSRAAAFTRIAENLPPQDGRSAPLLRAAERHAAASLPQVSGSDYMVEHWLAAYAMLLLS